MVKHCSKCDHRDKDKPVSKSGWCKLGYTNAQRTLQATINTVKASGIGEVCIENPHRREALRRVYG